MGGPTSGQLVSRTGTTGRTTPISLGNGNGIPVQRNSSNGIPAPHGGHEVVYHSSPVGGLHNGAPNSSHLASAPPIPPTGTYMQSSNEAAIDGAIGGGGVGGNAESHNHAIRGVVEKGALLNAEAAREVHYFIDRRRILPGVLQKLETETEACYSEIGSMAWNLGDYDKAYRSFEEALRRNPLCLQALHGMARYYKEKENHTKVVEYSSRSLAIDENGNEGEMWSTVGHALLLLGQLHKAYSCYQQAIAKAIRKDDPKLWYGIGILYDRYGSVEHAEEAFASVLKLDPSKAHTPYLYLSNYWFYEQNLCAQTFTNEMRYFFD